jgi:hypothetical protein
MAKSNTKIQRDFGRDNGESVPKDKTGNAMGGSTTNLSHSISGSSVPNSTK